MTTMKTAVLHFLQLKPSMTTVSCATASLAAELMAVLGEEIISLHRPGDLSEGAAKKEPRMIQIQILWDCI